MAVLPWSSVYVWCICLDVKTKVTTASPSVVHICLCGGFFSLLLPLNFFQQCFHSPYTFVRIYCYISLMPCRKNFAHRNLFCILPLIYLLILSLSVRVAFVSAFVSSIFCSHFILAFCRDSNATFYADNCYNFVADETFSRFVRQNVRLCRDMCVPATIWRDGWANITHQHKACAQIRS